MKVGGKMGNGADPGRGADLGILIQGEFRGEIMPPPQLLLVSAKGKKNIGCWDFVFSKVLDIHDIMIGQRVSCREYQKWYEDPIEIARIIIIVIILQL